MTAAPVITIFVRHTPKCKYRGDEFSKRCQCRKHFRWTHNGQQQRRKAGTRSWAEAEELKRDLEDSLAGRAKTKPNIKDIQTSIDVFLQDRQARGISKDAIAKYARELGRLREYCNLAGVYTIQSVTLEVLTGYCATWPETYPSSQTRSIVRARCRSFLRFCFEAQWIPRIPPLPKIRVTVHPTMPLTPEEFEALLAATSALKDPERQQRARAVFLLMRWSGLAIGDALKLERQRIMYESGMYRVVTTRQKTGTDVSVPLPPGIAREILAAPNEWTSSANGAKSVGDSKYLFWDGKSDIVNTWTRRLVPAVFAAAKIKRAGNMTSHRLRDTFAVDLLQKGVPLGDVSKALGHESIKTTEKHYAKWVKGRQDRLDDLIAGTW